MKKYKWLLLLLNLFFILGYANWHILKNESLLKEGELVLIELVPVDPRSLMQGDYMRLRYGLSNDSEIDTISRKGYCVVRLDANNVASMIRFQDNASPLNQGETLLRYTKKKYNTITVGADSYFFQEGQGMKYENAKYGGLKVDANGNTLLVGLYDADIQLIQ